MNKQSISVLGAGSWGTALAINLSRKGHSVCLWAHDSKHAGNLLKDKENIQYLSGISFPEALSVTADINQALHSVDAILVVVPSHVFRETLELVAKNVLHKMPHFAWATKGFEPKTALMLHQVAVEVLGAKTPVSVLSGPTFAPEVARGLPTAMVSASVHLGEAEYWAETFFSSSFRIYTGSDVIGVEIGGAYKNIIAIAAGISDGLNMGANAKAAIISRGMAEIIRFSQKLGGNPETLMGLAGLGDLVLTCNDNQSRNRRFGLSLAKGHSIEQVQAEIGQVVEGIKAVKAINKLAKTLNIELPIAKQVYKLVTGKITTQQAVQNLLSRSLKAEK